MKKLTTLLLAIILCFSLEACGTKTDLVPNSQEGHTQETSQKETEETNPESSNAAAQEETASGNTVPSNWEKATEDEPWKAALAEDLFETYGVLPEYYEDLGDGIYQVYVEVGGEVIPFGTVDSATGEYHE